MAKQVRIIAGTSVDGIEYAPNQVVEFSDKTAKELERDGFVDSNKDAVAYCVSDLGAVVVKHGSAE